MLKAGEVLFHKVGDTFVYCTLMNYISHCLCSNFIILLIVYVVTGFDQTKPVECFTILTFRKLQLHITVQLAPGLRHYSGLSRKWSVTWIWCCALPCVRIMKWVEGGWVRRNWWLDNLLVSSFTTDGDWHFQLTFISWKEVTGRIPETHNWESSFLCWFHNGSVLKRSEA